MVLPPERKAALAAAPETRRRFDARGLGKRREYAEYVAEAKRGATRRSRLARVLPLIAAGVGRNDKHRS